MQTREDTDGYSAFSRRQALILSRMGERAGGKTKKTRRVTVRYLFLQIHRQIRLPNTDFRKLPNKIFILNICVGRKRVNESPYQSRRFVFLAQMPQHRFGTDRLTSKAINFILPFDKPARYEKVPYDFLRELNRPRIAGGGR